MKRGATILDVLEAPNGWRNACTVCGAAPTRWKIDLPVPDQRGRHIAAFCDRHEANKDMLVAATEQLEEPL
jgi:hypothetical protein